jgi:NDP-sugar pyrophosphorylase family protein
MHCPLLIVPAGGEATRMGSLCHDVPKWALRIRGTRVIDHILGYWANYCARAVIVVRPKDAPGDGELSSSLPARFFGVDCANVNDAILKALKHAGGAPERFLVVLGDCLVEGEFAWPREEAHGIGVMAGDTDFARSYAVAAGSDGRVAGVIEKPLMGLGIYLLGRTAVRHLEQSDGITAAIDRLAAEERVAPMLLKGRYLNVTYPEDLTRW